MIFLKPEYLYMMVIPTIILFTLIITKKDPLDGYFSDEVLKKLRFDNDALGRVGRNLMIFVALFFMIIALGRPVLPKEDIVVKQKSIDMVIAVDISRSMMAKDLYPNRLEFAKKRIKEFIDQFDSANIGIIAFSGEAFLVSAKSSDKESLKYLLDHLSPDLLSQKGSYLELAIKKASDLLKKSSDKILVIFSDGGDDMVMDDKIALAKKYKDHIYIYATATKKGAMIYDNNRALLDSDGNIVITKLNEHLKELAINSGGAYILGGFSNDGIKKLANEIKKRYKANKMQNRVIKEYKELFYYPLALSLLFMLFLFHSIPKRGGSFALLFLLSLNSRVDARVFDFFDIKDANTHYKNREYKRALKYFQDIAFSKRSADAYYDLGNVYYRLKNYEGAIKAYKNVKTSDENLRYKSYFNMANSYFMLKEYQKALTSYEMAKKIKSEDDLLYNIELTKKMLDKNQKKSSKKTKKNKKPQNKKDAGSGSGKKMSQKNKDRKQEQKKINKSKKSSQSLDKKKSSKRLSKRELKMWQEHLDRIKVKTNPLKLKVDIKRKKDEKPW